MKKRSYIILVFILTIAIGNSLSQGIPQLIFYQGNLADNNGRSVSEDKSMTFRIYDAESGGTKLWEETHSPVAVNQGLFSVMLGSQNPISIDIFSAKTRFLEIVINTETLTPRQQIASLPYAYRSASVLGSSNVFPSMGNVGIGVTNPADQLEVKANLRISGDNSPSIEGGHFTLMDQDDNGGWEIDNFGDSGQEELRFFRDRGFNDAFNVLTLKNSGKVSVGTGGFEVAGMIHSTNGGFKFPDGTIQTSAGGGGGGISGNGTAGRLPYFVESQKLGDSGVFYENGHIGIGGSPVDANFFVHESGLMGPGITPPTYIARFQWGTFTQRHDVAYITTGGRGRFNGGVMGVASGGTAQAVFGHATNSSNVKNYGGYFQADGFSGRGIYSIGGENGYAAEFQGKVLITGRSSGHTVMELGEGLDYAEGFDVTQKAKITPGSILIIDPENPGKLALGNTAYDTRVAGIVAGAKNLGSGVRLGAGQFDYDVALAGRVYCNVEALEQAIKPGDLLTTSSVPGYAMKVNDFQRAQGAVIGKAMEGLEKGQKGQILVLVTLQ